MQNNLANPLELLLDFLQKQEVTEPVQNFQQIEQNPERLIDTLVLKFYSIEEEISKRSFIQNIHARLVWKIDYFTELKEPDAKEVHDKLSDNQKSILLILENLCTFILENFFEYCDRKQKLPLKFQEGFTSQILKKIENLDFSGNESDSILLVKVKTSINNKLEKNIGKITYGITFYLDKLFSEIEKIGAINRNNADSVDLRDILIAYNFNSLTVIHHLVSTIIEDIRTIESAKDKIERLNLWLKQINQILIYNEYSFNESRETVSACPAGTFTFG